MHPHPLLRGFADGGLNFPAKGGRQLQDGVFVGFCRGGGSRGEGGQGHALHFEAVASPGLSLTKPDDDGGLGTQSQVSRGPGCFGGFTEEGDEDGLDAGVLVYQQAQDAVVA